MTATRPSRPLPPPTAARLPRAEEAAGAAVRGAPAVAPVCPFLESVAGDWRAITPTREHRCAAFQPAASLAPEKQRRLCLTTEHVTCATYAAALRAREARVGSAAASARSGRWQIGRTAALVEDSGGRVAGLATLASDRRTWQLVPALVLVVAVLALAISNFRGEGPVTAISSPSPSHAPTVAPTVTIAPTEAIESGAPSVAPTPAETPPPSDVPPTAVPSAAASPRPSARASYTVRSGDTLYDIARKYSTTVAALMQANGLTSSSLHVGQVLLIP